MYPERSDATRIAVPAQSPRLFGVPVPARAFGFAPGWQLPARCWSTIDLRDGIRPEPGTERQLEDAVRVMRKGMDAVQPLMRTAPAAGSRAKRGSTRSHRPANRTTTEETTREEVAAA